MGAPLQEEALSLHPMRAAFLAYYRLNYGFDRFVSAPIQLVRCVADELQESTRTVTYDPVLRPADRPQPQRRALWTLQKADCLYTCELMFHDGFGSEARILVNGELFVSRRFEHEWQARQWAEQEKLFFEQSGE
jgi:hypothetical protein